ncbi:MAG: type II toxin-antitoxin system RelE/ParE family toxin [Proteobacteria bacterium]|nr:type II toxin-antitoxin system RelE/ParE family toxin [Pseudomonadota bacterium]
MLRLEWTTPAADQLEAAQAYYFELNPAATRLLAGRIVEAGKRLREHPEIGRFGLRAGTREWVVSRTPYLLVYRVQGDAVQILHVWHAAQDRAER